MKGLHIEGRRSKLEAASSRRTVPDAGKAYREMPFGAVETACSTHIAARPARNFDKAQEELYCSLNTSEKHTRAIPVLASLKKGDKMSQTPLPSDVLIVGAGPTGLSLAVALLRHGITPRLIEKPRTLLPIAKRWE